MHCVALGASGWSWECTRSPSSHGLPERVFTSAPNALGTLCWLFRDEIVKRLEAEVDAYIDGAETLSDDQRKKTEARFLDEILGVERMECELLASSGDVTERSLCSNSSS